MTDRLTLTRAFEGAGITSEAAERIATEIYDAIHDNVATKADLALAVRDLKIWVGSVLVIAVGVLLTGLGIATTVVLNRLPPAAVSAPKAPTAQHAQR